MSRVLWLPLTLFAWTCSAPSNVPASQANLAGPAPQAATLPAAPTQADLARQVARGKVVYTEQKCQACHAIAGVGNRRYPLDGVGDKLKDADIRKWIVAPREMNPRVTKRAFDKIPAADLDALVAYLKTLRKTP